MDTIKTLKQELADLPYNKKQAAQLNNLLRRAYLLGQQTSPLGRHVRRWIASEWKFRLGPRAYHGVGLQDLYVDSEAELRRAATGHPDLGAAGHAIGLVPCKKSKKSRRPRPTLRNRPRA